MTSHVLKLQVLQKSIQNLHTWLDKCHDSVDVVIPLQDFLEADPTHLTQLALQYKVWPFYMVNERLNTHFVTHCCVVVWHCWTLAKRRRDWEQVHIGLIQLTNLASHRNTLCIYKLLLFHLTPIPHELQCLVKSLNLFELCVYSNMWCMAVLVSKRWSCFCSKDHYHM